MIHEFPFDKLDWKVGSKRALHAGHVHQSTIPIWQMLQNVGKCWLCSIEVYPTRFEWQTRRLAGASLVRRHFKCLNWRYLTSMSALYTVTGGPVKGLQGIPPAKYGLIWRRTSYVETIAVWEAGLLVQIGSAGLCAWLNIWYMMIQYSHFPSWEPQSHPTTETEQIFINPY